MKLRIAYFLIILLSATSGLANADTVATPTDKSFEDARIETNIDNIYLEIKSGKLDHIDLIFLGAKRGYSNACLYVGFMFENGIGVARSSDKAFMWLKSCSAKNPYAAYNLGILYSEGRGTPKNIDLAISNFKASWPALKTQVPQIAIRLAYYYHSKKMWDESWDWAQKAAVISNSKKHGEYLLAKMIATGHSPEAADISVALHKATSSVMAYNPRAAELIAWIYGSGKTELPATEAKLTACQYDYIAGKMGGTQSNRYCGGLNRELQQDAEDWAKKYMINLKVPNKMDFVTLLDGKEYLKEGINKK